MRIILYVGKGGVGKTTISAATSVLLAAQGQRTLVVSTDTAHSLADSLGTGLKSTPTRVTDKLWGLEINALDEVRQHWGKLEGYFAAILKKKGADDVMAEELAMLPGMDEIISLLQIWKHSQSGEYDTVIIDAAPTGETVRLLSMPDMFNWYADRVNRWHTNTLKFAMPLVKPFMPKENVFEAIPVLAAQVAEMQKVFTNPAIASYRIVVNPEKMVVKEGQRAATYLGLFGYPIDGIVTNRVMPENSSDPFFASICAQQQQYRELIFRSFAPLPVFEVPLQPREVVGVAALESLAQQIYGKHKPDEIFFQGRTQEIVKIKDEYVLRLPLPNVEVDKVVMTKKGDELIVEIGNFKRDMQLPHSLATRNAKGARFKDGILHVHFSN